MLITYLYIMFLIYNSSIKGTLQITRSDPPPLPYGKKCGKLNFLADYPTKTWSEMSWNGLKSILKATCFFCFLFFESVENDLYWSPPKCEIFPYFFLTGSLKNIQFFAHAYKMKITKFPNNSMEIWMIFEE